MLQPRRKIRNIAAFFEEAQHPGTELWPFDIPVDAACVIGNGDERISGMMARRCHGRIGQGRNVQILREVRAHHLLLENLIEQSFVSGAQYDVMMAQIRVIVAAFIAEINYHQRHGLLTEFHQCIAVNAPMRFIHQL